MHKKSELSELPDGRLIDMETGKIYGKNELTGPKNEPEDEKATTIGPSNNSRPQEKQIVSIGRPTGSAGLLERVQPHDDDADISDSIVSSGLSSDS